MRRTYPLDGDGWLMRGFLGVEGAHRAARTAGQATPGATEEDAAIARDTGGWLPASVPGSVVHDLWRAGEVPDPYRERNTLACEWAAERAWLYRRRLEAPDIADGERAWLTFEGVDHAATVYLDGLEVARHEGMFVPFEVEVGDGLRGGGEHDLSVVIDAAPECEPQTGRTSRVRIHKSRMTYGWDFCPRIVHQGIWQPVSLELAGASRILDVWARPDLNGDGGRGYVAVDVALDGPAEVDLEAELLDGADVVATTSGPAGRLDLELARPRLWWPNGLGEAVVYRLRVRVRAGGEAVDEREVAVGFRTIELVPNEGGPPGARPYTFVVNGRRIYANGWNWVPADIFHGAVGPDRIAHLLGLAAAANVNLLRVWGGGLIETPAFYDACDRLGIMVWQEFSQSSSGIEDTPASDPDFVELMRREAEAIVPRRRNHPSLALWCGGNELADPEGPLEDARSPVLAGLHEVVSRHDLGRDWLPTSPTGPASLNRLELIEADPDGQHDVHGPWEHQGLERHYELANRATSLFHSEFGVEGMANRRIHEALIGAERRWPPTRTNPVYRHLGDWWINEPLVQMAFGRRLTDLDGLRRASQWLQAEGLRYVVEANRRRAFRNSGSIPWQFNEPYPNAWCTSVVDHRGDPKPAFFAVARAYAPSVVCAAFDRAVWAGHERFEASIWAWTAAASFSQVEARLLGMAGERLASASWRSELPADSPQRLGNLRARLATLPSDLFLVDLDLVLGDAAPVNRRYLFSRTTDFAPLLDLEAADVEVDVVRDAERWQLRLGHRGGPVAVGLTIEDDRPIEAAGWAVASDNLVDLLPTETRTIDVAWEGAPVDGRRLRISGWNVEPIDVG